MKQPTNKIKVLEADGDHGWNFFVDIDDDGLSGGNGGCISEGKTKQSALKTAKRRLERLAKEIDKMIEKGEG